MIDDTDHGGERWTRVEELFHAALGLADHEREAFLAAHCGDVDIRAEVDRLLVAHARTRGFLLEKPGEQEMDAEMALVGRRIGLYQLVEFVDSGGSGAVYRAVRADGASASWPGY